MLFLHSIIFCFIRIFAMFYISYRYKHIDKIMVRMRTYEGTPGSKPYEDYDPKRLSEAVEVVRAGVSKKRAAKRIKCLLVGWCQSSLENTRGVLDNL